VSGARLWGQAVPLCPGDPLRVPRRPFMIGDSGFLGAAPTAFKVSTACSERGPPWHQGGLTGAHPLGSPSGGDAICEVYVHIKK
jgi:hypothetical protein